ncbi:MAG TPA: PAS domain-containing protein [Acidobacteriota bacterium]|nr:PAS domain-containing protein [Acidobacteriota bacterium]
MLEPNPKRLDINNLPLAALVVGEDCVIQEWNDLAEFLLSEGETGEFEARAELLARQVLSQIKGRVAGLDSPISLGVKCPPAHLKAWASLLPKDGSGRHSYLLLLAEARAAEFHEEDASGADMFRSLMNSTTDNIYFKDANSRFLKINPATASWFGVRSPEEVVGKTDFDFFSDEHAQEAFQDEQEVIRTGQPIVGKEEKETWPDGRTTWVSTTKVPLRDANGKIIGTLGISRDITRNKQLEHVLNQTYELLETIFSSIHVKIAYMDTEFNFIRVNRAYAESDGREPEFFVGKNHFDLYPDAENEEIFRRVVATKAPYFAFKKAFVYPNNPERGTTYWDWSLEPVLDLQGELKGVVLSLIDVTQQTRAETALQTSREDLRRLSARLESVIEDERRRIAHELHDELGQSLTGLKMELARIVHDCAEMPHLALRLGSVVEMIGNCLDTVRRISQELRPAILDHLGLPAAVEWHAGEFEKRTGIKCSFESDLDQPNFDSETSTALFRIVQEALTNVARHSRATQVAVSLRRSEAGVTVEIRDNGRGIEENALRNSQSLGILGMRERASRLGGSLLIQSRPDLDGTSVRVTLPG